MKIYKVHVEYEAVVMAEDLIDAEDSVEFIVDMETPSIDIIEINTNNLGRSSLPPGWNLNTLIYHNGENDITVAQAIEQIKSE